ncbi:MAG: hypothetical protein ABIS50_04970 [Luteolibacter sp.]|uniref:hypothetical protein n=1 Tax=Luteolibacter sp. TaxID=1962973 RepID=UPI003263C527
MKTSALLLLFSTAAHAWPIYQLHEWGTFTTVSGSDGTLLSGLEREEETLPAFAHAHIGLENGQFPDMAEASRIYQKHGTLGIPSSFKGLGKRPLTGVTVKMETPVIYFHSNENAPIHAKVKVGFNGGTISQWYPQRSGGETLPEPAPSSDPTNKPTPLSAWTLDFNKSYQGAIEWDIDILTPDQTPDTVLFKPGDSLGWLRARQPVTNAVRSSNGETEGYLFYRGVGRFDPGLKTTVNADETLHLENNTGGRIPYLVAFEIVDGKLRWTEKTSGLDGGGSISIPESDLKDEPAGFSEPLYRAMKAGLARCGLTDAEAGAMVETWWHSYFEAPGLRVFWVLPRETTDRVLPLDVSPPAAEIVRVLVGRSEVLRPRKEKEWLAASHKTGEEANTWNYLVQADRFGLAIKERVKALEKSTSL